MFDPSDDENKNHGKRKGLYNRYHIAKANGKPVDPNAEYFVLRLDENGSDPKHIAACRKAVLVYADEIKDLLPALAKDLMDKYS